MNCDHQLKIYIMEKILEKFINEVVSLHKNMRLLLLLAWLILSTTLISCGASEIGHGTHSKMQCIGEEREALLQFKQGIPVDPCGVLASWTGEECCHWHGVHCSSHSGHVVGLDLHLAFSCSLKGRVSPSLVELKHLKYLDLSYNDFQYQPIPGVIGSLHSLRYLHLSNANFAGEIPRQLANLSSLTFLDLSNNYQCHSRSLEWLSHLTLLRDINFISVNLSQATDLIPIVNSLPLLRSLQLDYCDLSARIPRSLSYENSSTTLHVLSLAANALNDPSILPWVSNLTGINSSPLKHLDLSSNKIPGSIPSGFGNMHSLSYLDLSKNEIQGPMPGAFGNMRFISYLALSANRLEGLVPRSIFELKFLEHLDLSSNNFQGIESSDTVGHLCSLQTLLLSMNNITDDLSSILQAFSGCMNKSLVDLDVSYNRLRGSIPNMIGTFSSLETISLGGNSLNGTISPRLGRLSRLTSLDLSSNSWEGTLSDHHFSNLSSLSLLALYDNPELVVNFSTNWVPPFQLDLIFLRSCKLGPYFPKWLLSQTNFTILDISNAGIHDTIPLSFWKSLPSNLWQLNLSHNEISGVLPDLSISFPVVLDLSSNHMEGKMPSFLGDATVLILNDNRFSGSIAPLCQKTKGILEILDLSSNSLSGELPDCWEDAQELTILRLDNNNFAGGLPPSIGTLNQLMFLSLRKNRFSGELQMSFKNWTSLVILDVGYNSFTGHIPDGIGNTLKSIQILDLRRNNLSGRLPSSLCQLTSLQILDFSYNRVSGTIPECICNLLAMANSANNMSLTRGNGVLFADTFYYVITQMIMWKRKEQSFSSNLGLVRSIAMSNNELEGQIPSGFSCLRGLTSLDLARNNLTGSIPPEIGELASLEFLDLSRNHFSGEIPSSLAKLNFLGSLDLSYNNLSGKIPTGTQLQRFDLTAYIGNPGLCGPPLPGCTRDRASDNKLKGDNIPKEDNDGNDMFPGLLISVLLGFIVGFWGVCGSLVIKSSWRHTYFRSVENTYDRLYEMVVVRVWRRP